MVSFRLIYSPSRMTRNTTECKGLSEEIGFGVSHERICAVVAIALAGCFVLTNTNYGLVI